MGAATSAAPPSVIAGQYATSEIVKCRWSWVCSCKRRYSKFTTFTFYLLIYEHQESTEPQARPLVAWGRGHVAHH